MSRLKHRELRVLLNLYTLDADGIKDKVYSGIFDEYCMANRFAALAQSVFGLSADYVIIDGVNNNNNKQK